MIAVWAALVAALVAAAPADAAVKFGVVGNAMPRTGDLDAMQATNAAALRFTFNWSQMEQPRSPAFTRPSQAPGGCDNALFPGFARYDKLVSEASARGIPILPVLTGAPPYMEHWDGPDDGSEMPSSDGNGGLDYDDYKCWVRRMVQRWGPGGDYVELAGANPITAWQVWNEPNLNPYAPEGGPSPYEYSRLVKATSTAVRAVDPSATIVLAGMPERGRNGMNAYEFLRKFYRQKNIRGAFDVVAMHPYGTNAGEVKLVLERTRDVLREVGDGSRPLWVTEVGWATEGQDNSFLVTSSQGQATRLADTFRMLRNNQDRFKLGLVTWYSWRDRAEHSPSTEQWTDYAGLYRKDGQPKQACSRFIEFTGGTACPPIASPVGATESSLLAEGGDGLQAVRSR